MILKSIKDIKKGDQVTVSYVDLFAPRWERRGKLISSKHFWCGCRRCTENDKDLLLDGIKCKCGGYALGEGDLVCGECRLIITAPTASEILKKINTKIEYGMEIYGAGMFESASLALQEALDEALEKLHPHHGIFPSLLVNLVNLYCKTNKFILALKTCDNAVEKMKSIAGDADLGLLPELGVIYEKYIELAEIVIEAIKEGLIDEKEVDVEVMKTKTENAIFQSELIAKISRPERSVCYLRT